MTKLQALLKSRRFWAAVGGIAITILHETFGMTDEDATKLVTILGAWIIGDSLTKTT